MSDNLTTNITDIDTIQRFPLGKKYKVGANTYRYAYNAGATTWASGMVVCDDGATPYSCTCVNTQAKRNRARGYAISAIPQLSYGWIQTRGAITAQIVTVAGGLTLTGLIMYALSNATGHSGYQTVGVAPVVKPTGYQTALMASSGTTMAIYIELDD